ncbi:MAG TPA: DAK2 domain-containing protein [Candidatus Limnocylindrales bacterium]|nr:DAK2 domain-containing protein [Candidatus Limnocylindrales bacterium]
MITRELFRANQSLVADGYLVKQLFGAGLQWLEQNKEAVNRLNVFPVPDGDTGTNMYLTLRHAYLEIAHVEETHVGKLMRILSNGALRGARGNSGVILSQLFAGTAAALEGQEHVTASVFADATRTAVEYAYRAVEQPTEGTILTVSRKMMEAVQTNYSHDPDLIMLLKRMIVAGRVALRHTPDMLPVLKKAGVVDSGGAGLLYIFEGMLRALCGKPLEGVMLVDAPVTIVKHEETWEDALVPEDELGYGYDVQFLMRGESLNIDKVRADIQAMGWSTLVVGDNSLIKVHVHVHNPGDPLGYAITTAGASLDDIVVENMQRQYEEYLQARTQRDSEAAQESSGPAVIAVAAGAGMKRVFLEQLGAAAVISGGQTMNPSTGDFLSTINMLPQQEIILLPNNKNVLLAARLAAESVTDRNVRVVPTFSVPQGIAAMFEHQFLVESGLEFKLDAVVEAMVRAATSIKTLEVTNATRDVELEGLTVRAGQYIGLLDDKLVVAADSAQEVIVALLGKSGAASAERVTVYYGSDATHHQAKAMVEVLVEDFSGPEFEIVEGGQALYPYIMSVE